MEAWYVVIIVQFIFPITFDIFKSFVFIVTLLAVCACRLFVALIFGKMS